MKVVDDLSQVSLDRETILTIGTFDGVHRGHQALIARMVARARATDRLAALVTFHPHPAAILAPGRAPLYLTTPGEKLDLLEALDIDLVVLMPFHGELAATPADAFMESLCRHLRVRELWAGPDFALGHARTGTMSRLRELGQKLGYSVHVVERVLNQAGQEEIVSSSRIRTLLSEGRVQEAATLLGRYPSLSGTVAASPEQGGNLALPAVSLRVWPERAVPASGVYAVFALVGETRYPGLADVGLRSGQGSGQHAIRARILDWREGLPSCGLVLQFVARLGDLPPPEGGNPMAQFERDSQAARQILGGQAPEAGGLAGNRPPACAYRYEEVEHTADRALRVWGERLSGLFAGAARGMVDLMTDLDDRPADHWREIELEAWDRETLLVQWLNELLYLTESEGLIFTEYTLKSLTDTTLEARVGGKWAEVTKAHIKAATFHDLNLVQDESGWSALVTFDV